MLNISLFIKIMRYLIDKVQSICKLTSLIISSLSVYLSVENRFLVFDVDIWCRRRD